MFLSLRLEGAFDYGKAFVKSPLEQTEAKIKLLEEEIDHISKTLVEKENELKKLKPSDKAYVDLTKEINTLRDFRDNNLNEEFDSLLEKLESLQLAEQKSTLKNIKAKAIDYFQEAKKLYQDTKRKNFSVTRRQHYYEKIIIKCNQAKQLKECEAECFATHDKKKKTKLAPTYLQDLARIDEKYPLPGFEDSGLAWVFTSSFFMDVVNKQKQDEVKNFHRDVDMLMADVRAEMEGFPSVKKK